MGSVTRPRVFGDGVRHLLTFLWHKNQVEGRFGWLRNRQRETVRDPERLLRRSHAYS